MRLMMYLFQKKEKIDVECDFAPYSAKRNLAGNDIGFCTVT